MSGIKRSGLDALLAERVPAKPVAGDAEPDDQEEHARFFSVLRGVRDRAFNIEFRPAAGEWLLIEYSYFVNALWKNAGEFVLHFASGHVVTIKGRRLRSLYDGFRRHRVTHIRAADEGERLPDEELCVDEIGIHYPREAT